MRVRAKTRRSTSSGMCWALMSAEVGAYGESRGEQESGFEVGVALPVVLPESEDADGGEHGGERCALGAVLAHVKEIDQCGDHEDSAAKADYS